MKRILILVSTFAALFLLAGCTTKTTTVDTDEGPVKVTTKAGSGDWCQTGAEWQAASTGSTSKMVVEGIISSGKYAGYCHMTYGIQSEETTGKMDYYFKEDGSGYQVVEINGKTYESEWKK